MQLEEHGSDSIQDEAGPWADGHPVTFTGSDKATNYSRRTCSTVTHHTQRSRDAA